MSFKTAVKKSLGQTIKYVAVVGVLDFIGRVTLRMMGLTVEKQS